MLKNISNFLKRSIILSIVFVIFITPVVIGQATVGTIQNDPESLQGYTFFSPFSSTKAFLVDNCGHLVNEWSRGTKPGLAAYFLENGYVFRTYKIAPLGPFTSASNAGGLELVDWNNNTVWSYEFNTSTWLSHHDAVMMPNGNILVLTWELVFEDELIELGRDPNEIYSGGFMWSEKIIEIKPIIPNDMNIVWEWNIKDHYIQDFDPTKLNYGVVADHPELFNINLPDLNSSNSNSSRDWNHFNSIDYNPELDQILISVRNSDEIWILDHSTTIQEAASHSGGIYGKGGDILYRWGNASAYDRAPVSDQKLFGQHGVNWIKDGLADAGKILIYNNGNGRPGVDFSTVEILVPPQDSIGGYILPASDPFGPTEAEWIYGDQSGETFYSPYLSNAQRLPNGNTLINAGSPGSVFEIDPQKNTVWDYVIPLNGDFPVTQGQNANNNATFRAYKYPSDFPGFEGLDLSPGSTIENGNSPVDCQIFVGVNEDIIDPLKIEVTYNAVDQSLKINNSKFQRLKMTLFDSNGRNIIDHQTTSQEATIQLPKLANGLYFFRIISDDGQIFTKKLLLF